MVWQRNMTGLDERGSFRSLNGAADEQIVIGRATKAGFILFFKVWRDNPYDVVLDYQGHLFRIEIKGFSGNSVNVTRGGRSGEMIDRTVATRTRLINREDCDFVIAVNSTNGDCYIIPVDIIEIVGTENLQLNLIHSFLEKWELFMGGGLPLSLEVVRRGLIRASNRKVSWIARRLGIPPLGPTDTYRPRGTRRTFTYPERNLYNIYRIWQSL